MGTLADPNGTSWNAGWTKQLDKLTINKPALPLEKEEDSTNLKKRIAELKSLMIGKDNIIADFTKQISELKK